jgi:magnesium transporter
VPLYVGEWNNIKRVQTYNEKGDKVWEIDPTQSDMSQAEANTIVGKVLVGSSLRTIISYKEHEVKTDGSIDDLESGYNLWIDLINPNHDELLELAHKFNLDAEAIETYFNKSKKPEIRLLDNQTFTVLLDMKNKDPKTLDTEGIYFFLGRKWLITIHYPEVKLKELVDRDFKIKNKKIKEVTIAALFYSVLAEIVTKYEQLLTALELTVNEYQRRSFVRPSPEIFDSIDPPDKL